MRRALGLGWLWMAASALGCTGAQGAMGKPGEPGAQGDPGNSATLTPSISAVTPPYAYQGRTVDLTVVGSETSWSDKTTVSFAGPGVKVNKVTVASPTGLLVNVTLAPTATVASTDVTVTTGSAAQVYAGAFEVRAPLAVSTDQPAGVPQGGLATVEVDMLDLTTPFDPNTATLTLNSESLTVLQSTVDDYSLIFQVEADVLAALASVDIDVTSGSGSTTVDSQIRGAFSIVARAPKKLASTSIATGTIATTDDSGLYQYAPGGAGQRFVQFTLGPIPPSVMGTVIPETGLYADALTPDGFAVYYAQGTMSASPFYVVVSDVQTLFGPGTTPAPFTLGVFDSPCTAVAGTSMTTASSAQMITTLPALVTDSLSSASSTPTPNYYGFTLTSGSATIHVATGGDPMTDTVLYVYDPTMTLVGKSTDVDYQEDLAVLATVAGMYVVAVGPSSNFSPSDPGYQLFIDAQ